MSEASDDTKATVDRPRRVREGEELDLEALTPVLTGAIDGLRPPLQVEQFPSGHSNLTYALRDAGGREMVLRRPPFGANVKSGHDMGREYAILSALRPVFSRVPEPLFYTDDETILGAPFYVMERVRGVILRGAQPAGVSLEPTRMREVCEAVVDTLVAIHGVDWQATGLSDIGHPEGYVQRQVEGWTRRWERSKTDEIPAMDRVASWLADNLPAQTDATLIHNDFKYDNLVLDPDDLSRVVAVLDWEMATVGDPLMDLGTSLAYWVEPEDPQFMQAISGPTALPGNLTRREVADRYASRTGRDLTDLLFYYVYGLFKIGVIGQQIYFRFANGYTSDERFGMLIYAVRAIAERASASIDSGRI